ncbi:MAG: porin family protein [Dysgonomonas sp.]
MRKNYITLLSAFMLFFVSTTLKAQVARSGFDLGLKGGSYFSVISGSDDNSQSKIAPIGGITVSYTFPSSWGIESGLEITKKGSYLEDFRRTTESSYYVDNNINTTYLQMPIRAAYKAQSGKESNVVFFAGPYFAYGLDGKIKAEIRDPQGLATRATSQELLENAGYQNEQKAFESGTYKRFDYGVSAGIGFEFNKNIDARFTCDFGLADINDGFNGGRRSNQSGSFTIGYHF